MLQYYICMQYRYTVTQKIHIYTEMNLSTVKWAQWDKTQSTELLGLFICMCIALCTIVAHNIAQNRPDSFPSYPPHNQNSLSLIDWVKAVHPTRHKIGHCRDVLPSHSLDTEKTKSKPGETTTKIYNKPRLMQITKFTKHKITMYRIRNTKILLQLNINWNNLKAQVLLPIMTSGLETERACAQRKM